MTKLSKGLKRFFKKAHYVSWEKCRGWLSVTWANAMKNIHCLHYSLNITHKGIFYPQNIFNIFVNLCRFVISPPPPSGRCLKYSNFKWTLFFPFNHKYFLSCLDLHFSELLRVYNVLSLLVLCNILHAPSKKMRPLIWIEQTFFN